MSNFVYEPTKEYLRIRKEQMQSDLILQGLYNRFSHFFSIAPIKGMVLYKDGTSKVVYEYCWLRTFAYCRMEIKKYIETFYPEFKTHKQNERNRSKNTPPCG